MRIVAILVYVTGLMAADATMADRVPCTKPDEQPMAWKHVVVRAGFVLLWPVVVVARVGAWSIDPSTNAYVIGCEKKP